MKTTRIILCFAALALALVGCKKVDELPLHSNEIWPLAVGNTWTYVDSMILQTTAPTLDTVVSEMTFTVTSTTYADHLTKVDGKYIVQRIQGWEITNSDPQLEKWAVFLVGDSIYLQANYRFFFNMALWDCTTLQGGYDEGPITYRTQYDYPKLALVYPNIPNQRIVSFPALRQISNCIPVNFPTNDRVVFKMFFEPLTVMDPPMTVTTEAGTFPCVNYGVEWWSPGVGMIRNRQTGTTAFYDQNHQLQTGSMVWTRNLRSYHLE